MNFALKPKHILLGILIFAFFVRVVGIGYGLPLWLVSDEPPFIAASLKILELKNPILAMNSEAFKPIIYFPPYLAYIFTFPFFLILGVQYIFFKGTLQNFIQYIALDPSYLFIVARFLSALFGVATVYLVYKITQQIFNNKNASLCTSFFIATSILHIGLSMTARDWIFATFFFVLAMWFLSNNKYSFKKRYVAVSCIAGFAFGISLIAGFIMIFALLWYLLEEHNSILNVFREKWMYAALFVFLCLAAISIMIYPFGFHFWGDNSISQPKSFYGLIVSPYELFAPAVIAEPILFIFALFGFIALAKEKKRLGYIILLFCIIYSIIFYYSFYSAHRFTVYVIPLLAILAGYGYTYVREKFSNKIFRAICVALIIIPIISVLKLDWLVIKNDPRVQARSWVEKNLFANSRIIVYGRLTRLSSEKYAIEEQGIIDPKSLRSIDRAEEYFGKNPNAITTFHALNIHGITNKQFFEKIQNYIKENDYKYFLFVESKELADQKILSKFRNMAKNSRLLAQFGSEREHTSIDKGFFGSPIEIINMQSLGPRVFVFEVTNQ